MDDMLKKILIAVIVGLTFLGLVGLQGEKGAPARERAETPSVLPTLPPAAEVAVGYDQEVIQAWQGRRSKVQVNGSAVVSRILPDDNEGIRHQKFILRLSNGNTLLIAHNIDLAPRIGGLREGDMVEFYGVYEWNEKGGVVHWTHHDPRGRHVGGWLRHNGQTYQ